MRNYKHYNRYEKESKGFLIVSLIVVLVLIIMLALEMLGMFEEPLWKPDREYPIVNTHVSWLQTWYGGAF